MKRIHIVVSITTCLIFSLFLFGCGGSGPGAPGSCGAEDTGMHVEVINIQHFSPAVLEQERWLIDLYQDMCDEDVEAWGDDYANVIAVAVPIYDPDIVNTLYITNFRVTFDPLSPEYPPIDEIRAGTQGHILIPNLQAEYPFLIFDFGRKLELQDVLSRGVYPSNFPLLYNMTIQIWGQDMYGQDFCIGPIIRLIEIANYDYC